MTFSARRAAFRQRFYAAKRRLYRRLGRTVKPIVIALRFTAHDRMSQVISEARDRILSAFGLPPDLVGHNKAARVETTEPKLVVDCFSRVSPWKLRCWYIATKWMRMRRRLRLHRLRMRVKARKLRGLPRPASLVGVDLAVEPEKMVFSRWRVHESGTVEFLESWGEP